MYVFPFICLNCILKTVYWNQHGDNHVYLQFKCNYQLISFSNVFRDYGLSGICDSTFWILCIFLHTSHNATVKHKKYIFIKDIYTLSQKHEEYWCNSFKKKKLLTEDVSIFWLTFLCLVSMNSQHPLLPYGFREEPTNKTNKNKTKILLNQLWCHTLIRCCLCDREKHTWRV